MKKAIILVTLLALFLVGADNKPTKLYRLRIINKSGSELGIRLNGREYKNFYYLQVPRGDRESPTEEVFTILENTYRMRTYLFNPIDPDALDRCEESKTRTLSACRNIRITFTPCFAKKVPWGEPSMVKMPWVGKYIY